LGHRRSNRSTKKGKTQMMPLAILGVLIVALIIGYGVYMLSQNVTLKDKETKDRKDKE
jgi:high-affinity Fe2+/Pb2+ permease